MRLLVLNHSKKYKKNLCSQKPTIFDVLSLNKNCEKNHNDSSSQKTLNTKTENYNKIIIKKLLFKKNNVINRNPPISGKLFTFINSSVNKQSLGSIPTNSEKILLTSETPSNRFEGSNSIFSKINQNIPGVGNYNICTDDKTVNTILDYSDENRYKVINNNNPGVGEYDLEKGKKIFDSRNNLRYTNLYNKTRKLMINNINSINNNSYSNNVYKDLNNNINNNSDKENNSICLSPGSKDNKNAKIKKIKIYSYSCKKDIIHKLPEIQKRFIQNNININNNKTINASNDNYCRSGKTKKHRRIIFNTIDNNNENNSINIPMKQKHNKSENKVYTFEDIYKMYKKGGNITNEREELEKKLEENKNFNFSKKLKFNIKQDRELEKIKNILGNDNGKKDLFNLSPSRWKENKYKFKIPGPAYYFNS